MIRVEYKAQFYPPRETTVKHSIDLVFLKYLYKKFTEMDLEEFKKLLNTSKVFRNDLTHFINVIIWISDTLTLKEIKFLNSDYGALHLLTHIQIDKEGRLKYAKTIQKQIKDLCVVPKTWKPEKLI